MLGWLGGFFGVAGIGGGPGHYTWSVRFFDRF